MAEPILRVRSSGQGGSGYAIPTQQTNGKPRVVPGVTTVTGIADKPGIRQWAVDQTAAYAVTHVDALLSRSEVEGYGFLRYRWKREPKLDTDPNLRNWHEHVLNDAAELGTWFHEYIASDLTDGFTAEPTEEYQQQMVDAWNLFKFEHDVEALAVEQTVYNPVGYAGTLDFVMKVDGVPYLLDVKTGRGTWPEHLMQLGALGAAPVWLRQTEAGTPGAVEYKPRGKQSTWWVEDVLPSFGGYAILHVRPDDDDGTPAFCELKTFDPELIDIHYDWFLGFLGAKQSELRVKEWEKQNG